MAKQVLKAINTRPSRQPRKSGGGWIIALLLIALGGGGYYGYDTWQKNENEKKAAEAERLAKIAADKRLAEEMARLAAEKAKQDRLAAEQAERDRLAAEEEARRKAAEEEAKRRKSDSQEPVKPEPPPQTEPDEPEQPTGEKEKSAYDTPLPLHGAAGMDTRARKEFDALVDHMLKHRDFDAFETAMSSKIKESIATYAGHDKLN